MVAKTVIKLDSASIDMLGPAQFSVKAGVAGEPSYEFKAHSEDEMTKWTDTLQSACMDNSTDAAAEK